MSREFNDGSTILEEAIPLDGGYRLGNALYLLNAEREDKMYKINLGTGTVWTVVFIVNARHEQEAVDKVVDFCEANEIHSCYNTMDELEELCDEGQSVDDYAEDGGLTTGGNCGYYIELSGLEEY